MNSKIFALSALLSVAGCRSAVNGNLPPVPFESQSPVHSAHCAAGRPVRSISRRGLRQRRDLLGQYLEPVAARGVCRWLRVVIATETARGWQAIMAIAKINGSEPNAGSADQFNTEVVWSKDAATHFKELDRKSV